jgi:tRNA threonylcarbamoyladenosine biosynthesis protein TsaE
MKKDDRRPNSPGVTSPARSPDGQPPSRPRFSSRTVFSLTEDETLNFGRAFAGQLRGGELIILRGPLGAGKTVFARGVAIGLEIDPNEVSSPSFALIHEYRGGRLEVFHIDLYRLEAPEETETLGIEELLDSGGVVLVEWGERLPEHYRRDAVLISFHHIGEGSRRIDVQPAETYSTPDRGDA